MNRLVIVGLALGLACTASAGGNPDVRIYIDFDPPNYVHSIEPELYTTITACVCLDSLAEGMTCVSLRMNDMFEDCPGVFAPPSWQPAFPI